MPAGVPETVTLTQSHSIILPTQQVQFFAEVRDSEGSIVSNLPNFHWGSSDTGILSISTLGLATGVTEGTVTVTFTTDTTVFGSPKATASVTVSYCLLYTSPSPRD